MEYADIPLSERKATWYTVKAPVESKLIPAACWCNNHPSTGKFYSHYFTTPYWWFELERDALLFAMKWGN